MQHMQQNDQKMPPKSPQRLPKSSPRRPRCSQDGLLEPTWAPKCLPRRSKNSQKGLVFLLFFQVFGAKCSQEPPRTPKTAQLGAKRAPKSSPDPLWTLISIQFWTISDEMLKDFLSWFAFFCFPFLCSALRCLTGSTTNQTIPPHTKHTAETILLYRHAGGWCEAPRILGIW